ncbi:MAG: head GIN domain-containing protein [Tenuifilaceae bacterium]
MKNLSFLFKGLSIVALSLVLISSSFAQKSEERNVSGFTGIGLSISADIYLTQASNYKFVIEGDADYLEKIETIVDGDVLKIKNKERFNFDFNNKKVKIYISMPQINSLNISGSGDIKAQSAIKTDDLKIKISGSGNINVDNLSAKNLSIGISGSGDIHIAGTDIVESASYTISGSGKIKNENLQCKRVEIQVSGSGDVKVWAVDELKSKVSGSGDVYYKGRPIVDSKSSGSGGIRHIE